MAFNVYTSNRMELLVEYLSMVLEQKKLPPLESEIIIVQSQGMARFLSMELARRKRVWAGGSFPFPNAFFQDIFERTLGHPVSQEKWQRGALMWRIYTLLPSLLAKPEFAVLALYCQTPEKMFQLSQQVSHLFDQYMLGRPEMIQKWSKGEDLSWQAILWRCILEDIQQPDLTTQFVSVLAKLNENVVEDLPERVFLFGLSSMPPLMIDVFAALSAHIEVNVFFLNPCQVEWSQIMTSSTITKIEIVTGQDRETQFLENGNELLASMGHLGRDFFDLLLEHDPVISPMFIPASGSTLLARIQNDILDLKMPQGEMTFDDSMHLVSCHNSMREVEVLYDHLLHLFSDHPDLQPRDVLVMAPDIGVYAPLVDAVFRGEGKSLLPYSIADRSMQEQECFAGFLQLLEVAKGRWRMTEIMAILEIPALCRRFGFTGEDLDVIKRWLTDVHVHWGRDRQHRLDLGLPPSSEHSFRAGVNRLLLGYAMDGDDLFMGMLPFQGGELNVDVADKFLSFYEQLLGVASFLEEDKSAQDWSHGLLEIVDVFFAPTAEQEWEICQLRTIIGVLMSETDQGGFAQDISPEIIGVWLKNALNLDLSPYGFLSGGITFCSLLPMRAIPFQVICLLGMNEADFPRNQVRQGFDLMAREYRKGDRNKRNDDRYLFLEAILSARKQLVISFVGCSIIDNRQILPSVLVSELLDYIQASLGMDREIVVQHPVQPFNPDYFNGTLPLSYSRENFQACQVFIHEQQQEKRFLDDLDIPRQQEDRIAFSDLLRFWQNPCAFFCRNTLGLMWEDDQAQLEDDEPFILDGLQRYQVTAQCVELLLARKQPTLAKIRAAGFLPQGTVGDMAFATVVSRAEQLVTTLQPKMEISCENVQTVLDCGTYHLDSCLTSLYQSGQVLMRIGGKIDGRHLIKAWLQHLVLQLVDVDCARTTFLVSVDEMVTFAPFVNAEKVLGDVLERYCRGLEQPVPFFAKSSWEYVRVSAEKDAFTGLIQAGKLFNPEFKRFPPESENPAIARCFDDYVLGPAFEGVANQVFGPLLEVAIWT